jgi:hypothetical protein
MLSLTVTDLSRHMVHACFSHFVLTAWSVFLTYTLPLTMAIVFALDLEAEDVYHWPQWVRILFA